MKYSFVAALAVVSCASAHSWIECTNHDNSEMLPWMEGNATMSPAVIIDPGMPWYSQYCNGWPRNKKNPGNWIDDSSFYSYNIGDKSFLGDTHACHPDQRTPTYQANAPMSSAAPGDMIRLRFGGNGHTRGSNVPGDGTPGTVVVYWKGAPEQEITDISEFTKANTLQTGKFDDGSFSYPADLSIKTPLQGLVDKGNWMDLKLPSDMAPGRHMMVWVWQYPQTPVQPAWGTCFDVMISGDAKSPSTPTTPSSSAPVDPAPVVTSAAPVMSSPAPAASSPAVVTPEPIIAVAAVSASQAPASASPAASASSSLPSPQQFAEAPQPKAQENNDRVYWAGHPISRHHSRFFRTGF